MVNWISYKKLYFLLLFSSSIFGSTESLYAQISDSLKPKNVLVLFALEPSLPFYDNILENMRKKIKSEYSRPLNFYYEYAELSRFENDKQIAEFFEFNNKRYLKSKFDLFISIGPGLIPLVERFGGPFLGSLPKIFFEING